MERKPSSERRRWWLPDGVLPTTSAGALGAVVLALVGMRIGTLIQMAPSVVAGTRRSPIPWLYLSSWLVAAATSVAVCVVLLRRRRPMGQLGTAIDVLLAVALFIIGRYTITVDDRQGTWIGFVQGYGLNVLLTACIVQGTLFWLACLTTVVVAAIAYVAPTFHTSLAGTTVGNLLTYFVLAIVARVAVLYLLRIAEDADAARAQVAELARREEARRAQLAFHNGTALMRLLADPSIDADVQAGLRTQAEQEARRMRAYLRGDPLPVAADSEGYVALASTVAAAAQPFTDLPITLALDLGRDVRVRPVAARAIERAVTSILLNVRAHAGASAVVVHLDSDADDAWVLSIHDDGVGFDTDTTELGVGMREVVHGELARRDVDVLIESTPGVGTMVTLSRSRVSAGGRP